MGTSSAGAVLVLILMFGAAAEQTIELMDEWRFKPDPDNVGLAQLWYGPTFADDGWARIAAGRRWEDQGFEGIDGFAWYRRSVMIPSAWEGQKVWFVIGAINDAGTLFCNGQRVNAYGDATVNSMAATPVIADVSPFLRFGHENVIAIQVFDWGESGGLWKSPCLLTTDPARLPFDAVLSCITEYDAGKFSVDVNLAPLGNERPEATLRVALRRNDEEKPFVVRARSVPPDARNAVVEFSMPDAQADAQYRVEASLEGPDAKPIAGLILTAEARWPAPPAWPGVYSSLKVLNNFVTELLVVPRVEEDAKDYTLPNPRAGWVFFSISKDEKADRAIKARLDDGPEPLVWRVNPDSGALEAMRLLAEGGHRLRLEGARNLRLDVRTMPEIAFCYYPSGAHIAAYGKYDWAYMTRHVLPHVNTLITTGPDSPEPFDQWLREGRQWIANSSLPGLGSVKPPTADEVYEIWAKNPAVTQPGYAGMIVDEFLWSGAGHYRAWGEAVRRLHDNPAFAGKVFYAWCGDLYPHPPSLEFSRLLADLGYRFSWEKYLEEQPSLAKARQEMSRDLLRDMNAWKAAMPGIECKLVICLGYMSAPPESLNLNPGVDYHVFMDVQFQMLASEPAFAGLYGIMEYMAAYADEESLRYAHRLFRHYCIEGNRTRLNPDPYLLAHLQNPDFAAGLRSWTAEPAEAGSIDSKRMDGFSWLEGRYPKTSDGDQFCWMKRNAQRPNRISQTLGALDPNRLYSIKVIAADLKQLDQNQAVPLNVQLDGVEMRNEFCFQQVYPSCYSHEVKPYTREHRAYFTFYRLVFQPKDRTAKLVIGDWALPTDPGGPAGQEIAFNFVEVQPFHAP